MSNNTKQLPPFQFKITDTLSLEVNARVDERTEHEVYDEVMEAIREINYVVSKESDGKSNKITDIHWHSSAIMLRHNIEVTKLRLKDVPVKIYCLPNNENIYIEYDPSKTVDIQTVFYQGFNVKELILENKTWVNVICKQAIDEAKKETITQ